VAFYRPLFTLWCDDVLTRGRGGRGGGNADRASEFKRVFHSVYVTFKRYVLKLSRQNDDNLTDIFPRYCSFEAFNLTAQSLKNVPGGTDVLGKRKSVPGEIRIRASIFTSIFMLFYINILFKLIVSDALRTAIKHGCIF